MNDKDVLLKEYESLKSEINQKIELHNSLTMFMITTVIAILAFALESDNSLLYLLPFGIIIPVSMRIAYYRTAMVKLSAYISVFIEKRIKELNWETRNMHFVNKGENKLQNCFTISHFYEGLILSMICCVLFFLSYLNNNPASLCIILWTIFVLFLVAWEILITLRIKGIDKEKNDWIKSGKIQKIRINKKQLQYNLKI